PDYPGCWLRDDGKPRQTGMLSAPRRLKPNPDSCAERKPFCTADFFSGLLGVSTGPRRYTPALWLLAQEWPHPHSNIIP
ncbi:hypothetical protein, partial [Phaeovulum sp. NW3]|uniref:hypothetical protein n=1 Tax=Phaeovulum sp. NW3 TaxID=2934933 RepID=UPI002020C7D0